MSQLNLFEPMNQHQLSGVSSSPEVDRLLMWHSPVAIGISGGKDSGAAAWATLDYLDRFGHRGPRLLIHSDLGRIEWADSLPTCERLAKRLGVELCIVQRPAGGMVERWMSRWDSNVQRYIDLACVKLILPWSTPSMRFCTSELKTAIICRELIRRYPYQDIVSVAGIRRQESAKRAKKPIWSVQNKLTSSTHQTSGIDWNSIIEWSENQVWQCHHEHGLPIHEAYSTYKTSRVSCMFCIMSSLSDLIKSALCPGNQDVYRELCELEITSTFGFQDNQWLSDVAPKLLGDEQRHRLQVAKQLARYRELAENRIPEHLLYEEGWPKQLPTFSEAVLLAQVRQEVGQLLNLPVQFTSAGTILTRYNDLMRLKAQKEQIKLEREVKVLERQQSQLAA